MGAAQQLALEILKRQCQALEERYPGYRVDVVRRLGAILQLERQGPGSTAKDKVATELQDFGEMLGRKTGRTEET
jgi:hypothetical protein